MKPVLSAPLLGTTVRNPNFLRTGLTGLVLTALMLFIQVASSGLEWFGWALLAYFAGVTIFYLVSWRRATVEVHDDGVGVGGVFSDRFVPWHDIAHVTLLAPSRRTPFMLAFRPWADQARMHLCDGTTRRLRALQPWHGFTVMTYWSITGGTDTDEFVAAMNRHLEKARQA